MKKKEKLRNRILPYVVARRELWDIPRAIRECRKISEKDEDSLHILICDHIGDFIYTMGYMDELRKKNGYERAIIYVTEKFARLAKDLYLTAVDIIVVLNKQKLYSLLLINSTYRGAKEYKKIKNLFVVNPANAFTVGNYDYIENYPDACFSDCIKYGCLELASDAAFIPPGVAIYRNKDLHTIEDNSNYANSIILVPNARYLVESNKEIWTDIVAKLNSLGYKTYTAVADSNERPIDGSDALVSSLSELLIYAEKAKAVIGMRSGVFDLLAYTGADLIAIYPENCKNMGFYSLSHIPAHTAEYVELKESEILKRMQNIVSIRDLFV